jgi:hypothetical protein
VTLTITIETDNAAFAEDPHEETCRILRRLVAHIEGNGINEPLTLRDVNGNTVGRYEATS